MTKTELFLELAQPDEFGVSRWVYVTEFVGKYAELKIGNGLSWGRKESALAKKYEIEFDKNLTTGNSIDAIRLNGYNENNFSQYINAKIKRKIKSMRCPILGTSNPEVDHKNGMKNESRVMQNEDQKLSDFQPLSKAANDAKRQASVVSGMIRLNLESTLFKNFLKYKNIFVFENVEVTFKRTITPNALFICLTFCLAKIFYDNSL